MKSLVALSSVLSPRTPLHPKTTAWQTTTWHTPARMVTHFNNLSETGGTGASHDADLVLSLVLPRALRLAAATGLALTASLLSPYEATRREVPVQLQTGGRLASVTVEHPPCYGVVVIQRPSHAYGASVNASDVLLEQMPFGRGLARGTHARAEPSAATKTDDGGDDDGLTWVSTAAAGAAVACSSDEQCLATPTPANAAARCLPDAPGGSHCVTDHSPHNSTCACGVERCNSTVAAPAAAGKKQVLVIGDSISLGWMPRLRSLPASAGWQIVHAATHPGAAGPNGAPQNNANTNWISRCLSGWLTADARRWDVILLNAGLHDLAVDNQHVGLDNYAKLLREVLSTLLSGTRAKIVWLSTTPAPTDPPAALYPERTQTAVKEYNAAAHHLGSEIKVGACVCLLCNTDHFVIQQFFDILRSPKT